ncbi:hypothetical protein LCGC14_1624420 [marine sediment metagenome]|uniref:Tyr recombinase domain-containing protein n=1 Tax=marine sediment metagenome TaxID=412755 RepID=A0A0F9KK63_9ZZZZ
MSLYKPKKSPYWHFDFQTKGDRVYGSTGCKGHAEAEGVEDLERARAIYGRYIPSKEAMSLDIACDRYWIEVGVDQPSAKTTEYQLANLLAGLGKEMPLGEITTRAVADYIATRRARNTRRGTPPATASINREIELLRRVIYRARDTWEATVPTINWKALKLREAPPRQRVLSPDEERRLLDAAAPHLKAPIAFALITGVRLSNATGLDWRQVDFQSSTITLTVKGNRTVALPLTEALVVLLANQGPRDHGPVFRYRKRPVKSWRRAWTGALDRAGIEDFRWHDLRHTAATRTLRASGNLKAVKEMLGHADIASTSRYAHVVIDDVRAAMEAVESRNSPEPASARQTDQVRK